jgi:hypothetical protein
MGEGISRSSFDQVCALRPGAEHCSDQPIGRPIKRLTPKPRDSHPSIAAMTRAGGRKASDSVMRIERSVFFSRVAMERDGVARILYQFLLPAIRVAKGVGEKSARLSSNRPHRSGSSAFSLNDLAASIG